MAVIASQFYSFFGNFSQLFRIGFRTLVAFPDTVQEAGARMAPA
jgi:hypothetical protein